eukprot:m.361586 g.361586  ORF g.361586 m.361586 type:complete len:478 (-) comp56007_c0_seq17:89-1522(-)
MITVLTSVDEIGFTPLACAVRMGDFECLQILCEAGADLRTCTNSSWCTVLHLAAVFGQTAMVRHLLALQIFDCNCSGEEEGITPLMQAVRSGLIECCRALLDAGADPLLQSTNGHTVLHIACENGQPEVLDYLLSIDSVLQLLNVTSNSGRTPLVVAAEHSFLECAERLLQAGADPCIADQFGRTPLFYSAQDPRPNLLQQLLRVEGVDVNAQSQLKGETALMVAANRGLQANTQILVDAGADASIQDRKGRSALHLAAERCDPIIVEILLKACADQINLLDRDDETPLMFATLAEDDNEDNCLRTVELLLHYGALLHVVNKHGQTASDLVPTEFSRIRARLQEHEKFLANLGRNTKPALRMSAAAHPPTEEGESGQLLVWTPDNTADVHLDEDSESLQNATTTVTLSNRLSPFLSEAAVDQPTPVVLPGLGGLDEELAALISGLPDAQNEPASPAAIDSVPSVRPGQVVQDQTKAE